MFRIISNDAGANPSMVIYIDQLDTNTSSIYRMYCGDTQDTVAIAAYHDTEIWAISMFFGVLPDLAGFVVVMLIIQVLMIMYDNSMNPRGEADDVIGTDKSSKEDLLSRRNKEQERQNNM
jgi:hypothetical protein